ncbi:MAG: ABC transporter ATP-binding protein [Clostridiales bacterium]|nr:ABC transporter ATP-binding protein [Clostridiales bacterium]
MPFLELKSINKSFGKADKSVQVLTDLNLVVEKGEQLAIMGKSGCGKTTLLNILAGIDSPDSGKYYLDGKLIQIKSASEGVRFRRNTVGIVLQQFALINDFTAYENIELGLWESGLSKKDMKTQVSNMLEKLGITELKDKYPPTLSGGEKQRVAIGRALVGNPSLLLADEPTGSLDAGTEQHIISLLSELNKESGATLIIVTHDEEVAQKCNRVFHLEKH